MEMRASTHTESALTPWVCLLRGHAAVRRTLTAELQAAHGLTVNDYEALALLARAENGHMRRVDLAEALQLSPSGVTRLLDGLEEHGLVKKLACAGDGRVTYAVLTKQGLRKLEQAAIAHKAAIRVMFEERYTKQELRMLAELLGRLPGAGVKI